MPIGTSARDTPSWRHVRPHIVANLQARLRLHIIANSKPDSGRPDPGSRGGSAGAALDMLLTDATVGNPVVRLLRQPGEAARTAAKLAGRPDRLARQAGGFALQVTRIVRGSSTLAPAKGDRRFADPAWEKNWAFRRVVQTYLAAGGTAEQVIDDAGLDWRADTTARFVASNVHDLLAPTNFPWSNPAVLKETLDQGGANLVKGVRRAGRDVAARRLPAMVDTSRFEVGGNLALSPGAVVLRTEVFELLEYAPTTKTVHEVPTLIVPPSINKYYVLDLAPDRSIVEHLVAQGHRVFMISWRNPDEDEGHTTSTPTRTRSSRRGRPSPTSPGSRPSTSWARARAGS